MAVTEPTVTKVRLGRGGGREVELTLQDSRGCRVTASLDHGAVRRLRTALLFSLDTPTDPVVVAEVVEPFPRHGGEPLD